MQAVVFRSAGDIRLEEVPEPRIEQGSDALVHLTASAICGTDLHFVRGTVTGMKPGTILGHEGVGLVEATGREVRGLRDGDRVVICSTIACGVCVYCRAGYYSQCDRANPAGTGTAFFGSPAENGGFHGLQAPKARIPFAQTTLVPIPDSVTDDQALLTSDIFPTGYFAAELAHVHPGTTVAVFGCGPVGQFAIASLKLLDAGRIFAVDTIPSRLEMARVQGAEVIDYGRDDPMAAIKDLTAGIGVDRAIDAVGVDANRPHQGPAAEGESGSAREFEEEVRALAPQARPRDGHWNPGDGPSQALQWAVRALAKAGTLAIVGVYPAAARSFPIGVAMNRNLTLRMGNCPHRRYVPKLLELIASGVIEPTKLLTQSAPLSSAIEAYEAFDQRRPGWLKVKLEPQRAAMPRAA